MSDWTITFDSPISDLRVYAASWRGVFAGGPDPVEYGFSSDLSILSQDGDFTLIASDTVTTGTSGSAEGIFEFAGPITSLTLNTSATGSLAQEVTFGVDAPSEVIPLPLPAALLLTGLAGLGLAARRRR
ncbi:MAG: hypothetical protein ACFBSD_12590 [Paracoccaceae bacterium]